MDFSTLGFPVTHHQLPGFTQTHVHPVGDAIQPSHPLSSLFPLPSIFPSIRAFSNESVLHIRWPKYWSFSFSISPYNEYSGLISFRIDWFYFLAVQGTLKSLLQHHSKSINTLALSLLHNYSSQFIHKFLYKLFTSIIQLSLITYFENLQRLNNNNININKY